MRWLAEQTGLADLEVKEALAVIRQYLATDQLEEGIDKDKFQHIVEACCPA